MAERLSAAADRIASPELFSKLRAEAAPKPELKVVNNSAGSEKKDCSSLGQELKTQAAGRRMTRRPATNGWIGPTRSVGQIFRAGSVAL